MKKLLTVSLAFGVVVISACSSASPTEPRTRQSTVQRTNDEIDADCLASHTNVVVWEGETGAPICVAP